MYGGCHWKFWTPVLTLVLSDKANVDRLRVAELRTEIHVELNRANKLSNNEMWLRMYNCLQIVLDGCTPSELEASLTGATLKDVHRKGKHLWYGWHRTCTAIFTEHASLSWELNHVCALHITEKGTLVVPDMLGHRLFPQEPCKNPKNQRC